MKKSIIYFTIIIFLFSCKKDSDNNTSTPFSAEHGGVYVSSEGNFQSGNATLNYYKPDSKLVYADPFKQVNHQSLGDICQSMNIINDRLFIVLNNSGKIEVCNPYSLQKEFTITGLTSPRYIVSPNNSKAYVSDAYANHISIINLNSYSVSGTIPLNGFTEQMLLKNNHVYVTNTSSEYLYSIDPSSDLINDSILISKGANSIVEDTNGKIWVLCGGDYQHTFNPALYRINSITKQVEVTFTFPSTDYPTRLSINGTGDSLYYLNNGVFKMSIADFFIPVAPFIVSSANNFYGLGIDKIKNEIYVSDAIDYIQSGKVYRFHANGSQIDNFLAGIIPGDFLFLP